MPESNVCIEHNVSIIGRIFEPYYKSLMVKMHITVTVVWHSQTLFFLLCGGGKDRYYLSVEWHALLVMLEADQVFLCLIRKNNSYRLLSNYMQIIGLVLIGCQL